MERAGPTPPGGIRPHDLVELADRPGPFATVWMARSGTGAAGRQADGAIDRRVRSDLEGAGAPEAVLEAVDAAITGLDPGADGAVVVVDAEGALIVEALPEPPRAEWSRWSALPSITPVVEHRQAQIPAIVVLADRAGADLVITVDGDEAHVDIEGTDRPITKVRGGGWSHRRYQQRAQDSWEHNAKEVAEGIRGAASRAFPELVILGGDETAVGLIERDLPADLRAVTRTISAGRAADGSEHERERQVARLVRTAVAAETVELLRTFRQEEGRDARAANGAAETLAALRMSQVDVLLVHDADDDDRTAVIGTEPGDVGLERTDVLADDPVEARLIDVAVIAALRTGAAVRVVPDADAVDDGLAAILRWST